MKILTLNDFPSEILEKIFSYLPIESLLKCCLVCKRFNATIGSCSKLMKNIKICWKEANSNDAESVNGSIRKYRRISLEKTLGIMDCFENFVAHQADSLTHLNFAYCGLTSSELGIIIHYLKDNLKKISFSKILFARDVIAVPLNFPKLKSISFNSSDGCNTITDYFKNARTVEIFHYDKNYSYPMSAEELEKFIELLVSLVGLKELKFKFDLSQEIFRTSYFANTACFELEKLLLQMGPDYPVDEQDDIFIPDENNPQDHPVAIYDHYENFYIFMNKQREHLKELELSRFTISTEFLEMVLGTSRLNKLTLRYSDFQLFRKSYVQNITIKDLTIIMEEDMDDGIEPNSSVETGICEIIRCCKEVESFSFRNIGPSVNICTAILSYLKHLTFLHLDLLTMEPVTFPTVTSMKIDGYDNEQILSLLRMNRQLKHVRMPRYIENHNRNLVEAIAELGIESVEYK